MSSIRKRYQTSSNHTDDFEIERTIDASPSISSMKKIE
jgi:hypothetical protein